MDPEKKHVFPPVEPDFINPNSRGNTDDQHKRFKDLEALKAKEEEAAQIRLADERIAALALSERKAAEAAEADRLKKEMDALKAKEEEAAQIRLADERIAALALSERKAAEAAEADRLKKEMDALKVREEAAAQIRHADVLDTRTENQNMFDSPLSVSELAAKG